MLVRIGQSMAIWIRYINKKTPLFFKVFFESYKVCFFLDLFFFLEFLLSCDLS